MIDRKRRRRKTEAGGTVDNHNERGLPTKANKKESGAGYGITVTGTRDGRSKACQCHRSKG